MSGRSGADKKSQPGTEPAATGRVHPGLTRTVPDLSAETLNQLQAYFAAYPDVELAFLFGSRARGGARSDRDVDLGVLVRREALPSPTFPVRPWWPT